MGFTVNAEEAGQIIGVNEKTIRRYIKLPEAHPHHLVALSAKGGRRPKRVKDRLDPSREYDASPGAWAIHIEDLMALAKVLGRSVDEAELAKIEAKRKQGDATETLEVLTGVQEQVRTLEKKLARALEELEHARSTPSAAHLLESYQSRQDDRSVALSTSDDQDSYFAGLGFSATESAALRRYPVDKRQRSSQTSTSKYRYSPQEREAQEEYSFTIMGLIVWKNRQESEGFSEHDVGRIAYAHGINGDTARQSWAHRMDRQSRSSVETALIWMQAWILKQRGVIMWHCIDEDCPCATLPGEWRERTEEEARNAWIKAKNFSHDRKKARQSK